MLNLLFLVGMLWGVMGTSNLLLDPSLFIRIVLGLGVVSVVLTVGAPVYTVLAWKNSYWGIAGRAYDTLVTVAAIAFVWFMNYWNLLVVQRDVAAGPGISAHAHQEGAKGNHRH